MHFAKRAIYTCYNVQQSCFHATCDQVETCCGCRRLSAHELGEKMGKKETDDRGTLPDTGRLVFDDRVTLLKFANQVLALEARGIIWQTFW